jgi:hypothetical protein
MLLREKSPALARNQTLAIQAVAHHDTDRYTSWCVRTLFFLQ